MSFKTMDDGQVLLYDVSETCNQEKLLRLSAIAFIEIKSRKCYLAIHLWLLKYKFKNAYMHFLKEAGQDYDFA